MWQKTSTHAFLLTVISECLYAHNVSVLLCKIEVHYQFSYTLQFFHADDIFQLWIVVTLVPADLSDYGNFP